ncbi:MAG: LysR substrate-binding domain-containing protein [Parvibaculaceae bacterium]|nr:LysR substrate-binding domain-containing protein [Parvibaculaceae bacterium]
MDRSQPGWELYRSFLAAMREGSLSAAARALALTQPTVGRHIDELEASLSVTLFIRSQAGLTPTGAALELMPHVEAMASAAEALVRTASGEAAGERGTVRLTASEMVGAEILPPMLARFHAAHPHIAIELMLSNRSEDLLRREADIAIRMVRPAQTALIARKIGEVTLGLHARKDYLDRRGRPGSLEALDGHSLIGFDQHTISVQSLKGQGLGPLTRENFSFRSDSDLAQLALLRAGCGIGVCQHGIAARDLMLEAILPHAMRFALPVWLVMHENLKASTRVRLLYDHLAEDFSRYLRSLPAAGMVRSREP